MPTLADQIAPKPQEPSGLGGWLASIGDEMAGAFARYGRRSGAQRDASLALLNQASAPGTDPIMGAGQKLLGLAGLVTHPLAFFPTGDEWRERLSNAGNTGRLGQAIGGALGDLPSIVDPHLLAGGGVLAAAPLAAKMLNTADDVADASRGFTVFHGTGKESADEIQKGGFKIFGGGDQDQFPIPGISTTPSKGTAQYYAAGENYLKESDRLDPVVMELRVSGDKSMFPSFARASKEYEAAGGDLADSAAFLEFLKGKGYKGVREGDEYRVFDPADIQVVNIHPMRYGENGLEQFGGSPSNVSREQALQGLVGGAEDPGIIAYHGSPHSFDKFDMSKIGTGEGNQAYMRGLYFAEAEDTAKSYRDVLSSNRPITQDNLANLDFEEQFKIGDAIQQAGEKAGFNTNSPDAFSLVLNRLAGHNINTAHPVHDKARMALDEVVQHVPEDVKTLVAQKIKPPTGSMYQVKIDATPEEFLSWDIPLSQQPKKVQDALRGLDPSLFAVDTWASKLEGAKTKGRTVSYGPDNRTGETAARAFEENLGGPEMAAEKLKAAGIKGVRYKDAGSRGTDGGTYNYVVFDDKLITILKKYGIPMTAGAGGAMMVAGQDMPPEFASQMGGT